MDPTLEKEHEIMQFGAEWCPIQMFDASHFDDLKLTEAPEGLLGFSFPSKPQHGQDLEFQQDLDSPVLDLDWMEQTGLQEYEDLLSMLVPDDPVNSTQNDLSVVLSENCSSLSESIENKTEQFFQHGSDNSTLMLHNTSEVLVIPVICDKVEFASPCSSPKTHFVPAITLSTEASTIEDVSLKVEEDLSPLSSSNFTPLSSEDIDSFLSSPSSDLSPSSSSVYESPSSVDTASLSSDDNSRLCNSELYKIIASDQISTKQRPTPYSRSANVNGKSSKSKGRRQTASICPSPTELELEMMSKKDRKKMQNKNAAIRYRMKKKEEAHHKRSEVDDLEATNRDLHEKVSDLARQIKYMKDLINDVRKARGLTPYSV